MEMLMYNPNDGLIQKERGSRKAAALLPFIAGNASMCVGINLTAVKFGMQDVLRGIDAVVAGEEVGDGNRQQVEAGTAKAEHFTADQERGNGTIRYTAEYAGHADGRIEGRIGSE